MLHYYITPLPKKQSRFTNSCRGAYSRIGCFILQVSGGTVKNADGTTATATGIGLTYQWQYIAGDDWKNSDASGNKTAALTIFGKTTCNVWKYRCIITDGNGAKTISGTAQLTVK